MLYANIVVLKKNGNPTGRAFPLKRRTCVVGSDKERADICLLRDEVWDKHAKIEVQADTNFLFITNLAYFSGVMVNDVGMTEYQKLKLEDKDVITICGRSFRVELPPFPELKFTGLHIRH